MLLSPRRASNLPSVVVTLLYMTTSSNQQQICSTEEMNMSTCMNIRNDPLFDAEACESCVADAIPTRPTFCGDLSESVCPAIYHCPCHGCENYIHSFANCTLHNVTGCDVVCEKESAGIVACKQQQEDLLECLASSNLDEGQSQQCASCIKSNFPSQQQGGTSSSNTNANNNICEVSSSQVCSVLTTCSCGSCEGKLAAYTACASGCDVTCSTADTDTAPVVVVQDPTTSKPNTQPSIDLSVPPSLDEPVNNLPTTDENPDGPDATSDFTSSSRPNVYITTTSSLLHLFRVVLLVIIVRYHV